MMHEDQRGLRMEIPVRIGGFSVQYNFYTHIGKISRNGKAIP